jgi:hypothetical protein
VTVSWNAQVDAIEYVVRIDPTSGSTETELLSVAM